MSAQRYKTLLDKSVSAVVSAIEIYNKPDFKYREETFSILMVNAWELLLKAKILKDNKNILKSIYRSDRTKTKKGDAIKRFYPKLNRVGNPMTIDILEGLKVVKNIDSVLKNNIFLLIEIRDNSIHFFNKTPNFKRKVLEIGTANLKSYVEIMNKWFKYSLDKYNFYLMPISFFHSYELESFSVNDKKIQVKNLINYIEKIEKKYPSNPENDFNISLKLKTKFVRSDEGLKVKYDENADLKVKLEAEEQFIKKYPLDYFNLIGKLKNKYNNFIINNKFYKIKNNLEKNEKFVGIRYLDVVNKKGTFKKYYSTEVFKEYDKHYHKK